MSATTQLLLEEIKILEGKLLTSRDANDPIAVMALERKLQELRKSLTKASELLNENSSVLKG